MTTPTDRGESPIDQPTRLLPGAAFRPSQAEWISGRLYAPPWGPEGAVANRRLVRLTNGAYALVVEISQGSYGAVGPIPEDDVEAIAWARRACRAEAAVPGLKPVKAARRGRPVRPKPASTPTLRLPNGRKVGLRRATAEEALAYLEQRGWSITDALAKGLELLAEREREREIKDRCPALGEWSEGEAAIAT
jgi:hypothetical protein